MVRNLTDLEHFLSAAETLQDIQARRPAIARFQVGSVLKTGPGATLFDGQYGDRPAVLKLFHGPHRTDRARAQKRELVRLGAFMDRGRYRVVPLIQAWPGEGITVTGRIDGQSMDRLLAACRPDDRDALLGGAGHWLAHLVAAATRRSDFGGRYWVRVRTEALEPLADGPDGALARALAARLAVQLSTVAGHEITQARCHGDFAPANLMVTQSAVVGIDIQNTHWLPLAKDVARFLVYLQTAHPRPGPADHFGLAAADLAALCDPLAMLSRIDRDLLLPFFIGVELADKLATSDRDTPRADRLRRAITAYLDSPVRPAR